MFVNKLVELEQSDRTYRIPLSYNPIDIPGLQRVLQRYEHAHHNRLIDDFEKEVATFTGARYALALNSGTAAIHLGLKALGVTAGDVVLVSSFTYVASVSPVIYLGATPVLIDAEATTWNMDPILLEEAIKDLLRKGKKPKAILVVHVFGMPACMKELQTIAAKYEISILEDAAEALGSSYEGKHVGTLGEAGILSFNNNKLLTTYGGGVLLTNKEEVYRKARRWANQAREDKPFYEHAEAGYSYRMGPLNAATGLSQIEHLTAAIQERRQLYEQYRKDLSACNITFFDEPEGYRSNRWLSTIVLDKDGIRFAAADVVNCLMTDGIEARYLWNPMHRQPAFKHCASYLSGVSDRLFETGICLPSGKMTGDEYVFLLDKLTHCLKSSVMLI